MTFTTVNWNTIEDEFDEYVWDKATAQFWLDTRVPVSHDLATWRTLSPTEKDVINKAVGGLALLDTLQSEEGVNVMREDARTRKEAAVINDFLMMESIHAKSYGTILISLNDQKTINAVYDWMNNDPRMQYKARVINEIYQTGNNIEKKVASVFLEGILYYTNFFTPLWYRGNNKLANLSEIIKLVIRDESVHGTYLATSSNSASTSSPMPRRRPSKPGWTTYSTTCSKTNSPLATPYTRRSGWPMRSNNSCAITPTSPCRTWASLPASSTPRSKTSTRSS